MSAHKPLRSSFVVFSVMVIAAACLSRAAAEDAPGIAASEWGFAETDWPWWRGPDRNGIAAANQKPPLSWSNSQNVVWRTAVPGRSHGSTIVVGNHVLLQTADLANAQQSVICLDRATGKEVWKTVVHAGGMDGKENAKSTLASSTPACDGERIFVNFLNGGSVHTTALDRSGKKLWQTRITEFVVHQGFASSPALYESLVLVSADNKGNGALVALNRKSGEVVWRQERPKVPNYTSPIILRIAGKDQALFTGCDLVTSLDPRTGKKLWEIAGATTECVTSTVTDGNLIFTSGGYPKNHISAVRADGSGEVVWESNSRVYVPSMLVREGHLYAVLDAGVAACFESATGKELWKGRIAGTFSSSPVLVDDKIFVVNEAGHAYIFKASPEGFSLIGENQLGDECFATPVFAGNRIYLRVAMGTEQQRQEYVYCLGE